MSTNFILNTLVSVFIVIFASLAFISTLLSKRIKFLDQRGVHGLPSYKVTRSAIETIQLWQFLFKSEYKKIGDNKLTLLSKLTIIFSLAMLFLIFAIGILIPLQKM